MRDKVCVGLVGCGYWGPNLARNLFQNPKCSLKLVCDVDEGKGRYVKQHYPTVGFVTDHVDVLDDPEVDAVVIALPVSEHYEYARQALLKDKHVLVEKPLSLHASDARELVDLANSRQKVLMVGHTFLYNAAVREIKEYIDNGDLGNIYYIYSQRVNLGRVKSDINVMWNLAPHDVSIALYWLQEDPIRVSAKGVTKLQDGIEDVVFLNIDFPHGVTVHIHVSWLDPGKIRKMTVVGSKKMVVYDDVSPDAKIRIYDKGIDKITSKYAHGEAYDTFGKYQLLLRAGDLHIPRVDFVEPLKTECEHFIECIIEGKAPLTDGENGLKVVKVLEAAQSSLKNDGRPVDLI